MTTQLTNHEGKATLTLVGRLDTSAAQALSAELEQRLSESGTIESLVVDADGLEYISSSGLRVLLSLTKRYNDFRIIGVQPAVYDVLAMTGFTKIMNVERAMRRLCVDGCEVIGIGGVGTVYRLDDETIIKALVNITSLFIFDRPR